MKLLHSTYYILVILCFTMVSCNTTPMDEDISSKGTAETMVKLTITFPADDAASASKGARYTNKSNDPNGTDGERYISDAHIYIFQNGKYVETAQYLLIGGNNGDITRTIEGKISKAYTTGSAEIVLLTNTEQKHVGAPTLTVGVSTKEDLYNQLVYTHTNQDWKENIPMWGVSTIKNINGLYHSANITLIRAVAKVQVTVNDGQGLENEQGITYFQIKSIKVADHNTQGYCATTKEGVLYIPSGATNPKASMTFSNLDYTQGNYFVNQIYIPEHQNIDSNSKVYLEITALAYGEEKTYDLAFKNEYNAECDVLRNHVYIFNIVSVEPNETSVGLSYTVKDWEEKINIDVPGFGKEE